MSIKRLESPLIESWNLELLRIDDRIKNIEIEFDWWFESNDKASS